MTWGNYLFDFKGRASRLDYWRYQLVAGVALLPIIWLTVAAANSGLPGVIPFALTAPLLLAGLAIGIRRLHDRGKSGWWGLVFWLAPYTLVVTLNYATRLNFLMGVPLVAAILLTALGLHLWGWIELGFVRGARGPNRFGRDAPTWPRKATA